jgi:hypothetical protein
VYVGHVTVGTQSSALRLVHQRGAEKGPASAGSAAAPDLRATRIARFFPSPPRRRAPAPATFANVQRRRRGIRGGRPRTRSNDRLTPAHVSPDNAPIQATAP